MVDRNMKFNLDFTAKTKGLKDAKKDADGLADSLEDTESAAQQLAKAMHAEADRVENDLRETTRLADRLAQALGPDMAAKIGQSDLNMVANRIRDVGGSADLTEDDVKALADGIRELDRVADQTKGSLGGVDDGLTQVDTKLRNVGDTADNSRSVMANMMGNAVQELPGVASALGPVSMALGQLGEYAAEGNIKLSQLAKFAGPMAAVGIGVSLISSHMEQVAKSKAFHAARVEAFTKALKDGATAAEAWDAALTEDNTKIEFIDAATGDVSNFTDELFRNQVTWEQFSSHLTDSESDFRDWARSVFGANADLGDLNAAYQVYWQLTEAASKATQKATEEEFVFAKTTKEVAKEVRGLSGDTRKAKEAMEGAATATAAMDRAYSDLLGEIDDEQAWLDLQDNLDAYIEKQGDAEASDREKRQSTLDMAESLTIYTQGLEGIPDEKKTEVLALIDQGRLDEANYLLAILTAERDVKINPVVGKGAAGSFTITPNSKYAAGTKKAKAGVALVGEQGPELVMMNGGEKVIPAGRTASMLSGASGGGAPMINLTINAGLGTNGPELGRVVINAINEAYRNGNPRING